MCQLSLDTLPNIFSLLFCGQAGDALHINIAYIPGGIAAGVFDQEQHPPFLSLWNTVSRTNKSSQDSKHANSALLLISRPYVSPLRLRPYVPSALRYTKEGYAQSADPDALFHHPARLRSQARRILPLCQTHWHMYKAGQEEYRHQTFLN